MFDEGLPEYSVEKSDNNLWHNYPNCWQLTFTVSF